MGNGDEKGHGYQLRTVLVILDEMLLSVAL